MKSAQRATALDRDFILVIKRAEPFGTRAFAKKTPDGESAVLVAFKPHFEDGEEDEAPAELIFLVDRSGSMAGISIAEARNALQLCLRSLREGVDFNVAGFGDTLSRASSRAAPTARRP